MTDETQPVDETLTDGMDTSIPNNESGDASDDTLTDAPVIPDGFDDKMYDTENKTLRLDAVKERLDADKKEIESYKKQALDMRRKMSKGHDVPESEDGYEYVPDQKYDKYTLDEESIQGKHIKETMDYINKLSFENGLNKEQSKAIKTAMLEYMENVHILDTRSDAEIAEDKSKKLAEQRDIVGPDYKKVIGDNVSFYRDRGPFTKEERQEIMKLINTSGHMNNVFYKMREMLDSGTISDIPQSSSQTSAQDSLRAEYYAPNTSDRRREQILQQASREGWTVSGNTYE